MFKAYPLSVPLMTSDYPFEHNSHPLPITIIENNSRIIKKTKTININYFNFFLVISRLPLTLSQNRREMRFKPFQLRNEITKKFQCKSNFSELGQKVHRLNSVNIFCFINIIIINPLYLLFLFHYSLLKQYIFLKSVNEVSS